MKATRNKKQKTPEEHKTCFVSKETFNREEMLRFVVSPDKVVFFDVAEKLPGRGMWLKSDYKTLQEAVDKRIFYKAAKGTVQIPEDLLEQVEQGLRQKVLSSMGLARKSGALVFGYEAVKKSLQNEKAVMAFEAQDSSGRERNKLYYYEQDLPVCALFSREDLGRVVGQDVGVHVGILKSKIAKEVKQNAYRLALFLKSKKEG